MRKASRIPTVILAFWAVIGFQVGASSQSALPRDVVKDALASVVAVIVETPERLSPQPLRPPSAGTGFFITREGHVVTEHSTVKGASKIELLLHDGERLGAQIVGLDARSGLALLKAMANKNFAALSFAPEDARAGDLVFQLTPEPATILTYVSAADPLFLKLHVHTRRGTPGGPLVNMSGAVVGVVMAHLRTKDGPISNTSFAVPAKLAARVTEALRTKGKVDRGWLGLQMQNISPDVAQRLGLLEPKGMLIAKVFEGGPGSAAGLKIGDVVLQINDVRVLDAADFARKLDNFPPGATVRLNIVRGGQVQVLDVKVGLLPPR